MANEANHDENSDPDYIAFDLERNPAGLRVETSRDNVWTFRRDVDAYNEGEEVWIPDFDDTPSAIITMLRYEGYNIVDAD
jgi:hypothetical protein